jgi:hypothetical protein
MTTKLNKLELTNQECATLYIALAAFAARCDANLNEQYRLYTETGNQQCLENMKASRQLKADAMALQRKF